MTNKEFFTAVIAANIAEDITAKAQHLLEQTENKSTKRSKAQTENRTANIAIAKAIAAAIGDTTMAASEIKVAIAATYPDISLAKITAVCKVGADEGIISIIDGYKVGGKGRTVKGYAATPPTIAENEDEFED